MADKLNLSFTVPSANLAEREVDEVVLPATNGEIGILPGHDSIMSTLDVGVVTVRNDNASDIFFVAGGYFEVHDDTLIIVAEVAEHTKNIDIERARLSKKRAEERLAKSGDELDTARAEYALKRALFRLEAAGQGQ